ILTKESRGFDFPLNLFISIRSRAGYFFNHQGNCSSTFTDYATVSLISKAIVAVLGKSNFLIGDQIYPIDIILASFISSMNTRPRKY
ncbi:hypothetical protein MXB_1469, partial [Myxobolus squamalis]